MFAKSRIIATFLLAALLIVGLASSLHAATVANALDFDGVNDSVTIATLTNVPLANTARTVEAWVKVPPTFTGYGMVFAYGGTAFLSRLSVGIQGGKVTVEANNSTVTWPATVNDGAWHHLAVAYPGSGGIVAASVYLDGTALTGPVSTGGNLALATVSGPAYVGSLNGASYFLAGTIDELRVWNVARTQAQIQAAKGAELTGTETGLVAYYPFNQGVASGTNTGLTTLNDLTSGASAGTLNSFALSGATSNWVGGATALVVPTATATNNTATATTTTIAATATATKTATPTATKTATPTATVTPPPPSKLLYVNGKATGTGDGTSWANAYPKLQDALAAATSGTEIWVAQGLYYPDEGQGQTNNDPYTTFTLRDGVAIYGSFGGTETSRDQRPVWPVWPPSMLSGDLEQNDATKIVGTNAYHVVIANNVSAATVLDGFYITAGNAQGMNGGGGMSNNDGSPTLSNLTFNGNSTKGLGGGMYNGFGSNPTLNNVTFSYNTANLRGGGMYNYGNSTLNNVTFSYNTATLNGGGMANNYDSNPTLTNVTFTGNSASENGGGMFNNIYSNPTLTNVTFSGNTAKANGGGMFNDSNSNPMLTNVTFTGNTANSHGGGMYNYNLLDPILKSFNNPTLINVTFSGNTANLDGGGMVNNGGSPTLTNVTFTGNTAKRDGGGMANYNGGSLTLTKSTFINNTSSSNGGGMYDNGSSTLTNVTFTSNSASENGGGMFNDGIKPTLTSVTFRGNTAFYGGGMYNYSSSPTLTKSTFINNTSSSNGGGMYNDTDSNPTLTNVYFGGNIAVANISFNVYGHGGGMYNDGSPTLTNVTFRGNTALYGGGVYNPKQQITAKNTLLDGNSAKENTSSHQYYGSMTATTSWLSPNNTSAPQVKLDSNGKPTAPTGLQIGTTCPATDLVGTKRGTTCTVGAYEFTGKLAGSTTTAALSEVILASETLSWNTDAGSVTLDVPTGAITQPTWLFYDPDSATAPALVNFSLSAASDGTFQALPAFAFAVPVNLTIPFTVTEALELRRFDATAGVWTTEGVTAAGQTATSLSFTLTQMGQYALFPVPTSVWIEARANSPAGLQAIPGGTQVTYELTLHNAGQSIASGVAVSDTLPLGVTFATWVSQDTAIIDGTRISWQPADIAVGGSASISFTVNTSNAAPYLGQSIVNAAVYTVGNTSDSAQVAFSLNGPPSVSDISMTTPANTALTISPLLLGVSNPDGSPITMSIGTPQHGAATLVGDTIIYTPTADFLGNDSFSYTVQDASFQVSAAVQVRVANLAFPFLMQQVNARTIMPGQTLTYTLSLGNGAEQALQQGTITVTLPISLTFGKWITQDTATLAGRIITWGPSDLGLNTSKAISFTVVVNRAAEGTMLASTAYLTAANADPASDTLTLDVMTPLRTYLPVMRR